VSASRASRGAEVRLHVQGRRRNDGGDPGAYCRGCKAGIWGCITVPEGRPGGAVGLGAEGETRFKGGLNVFCQH
jgi:hypothetical protein